METLEGLVLVQAQQCLYSRPSGEKTIALLQGYLICFISDCPTSAVRFDCASPKNHDDAKSAP